ncbi:sulfate/molybdate ABC transporter ATP-binding protein [Dyadobacter flavalbus]|nr:ABC transporter ATP-binding protein [Dyadobacter flavalbus]
MSDNLLDINIRHSLHTAHGTLPMEVVFTLKQGNILAVTGPSGAGKTTLLKQIAGLINPQSGKITFDGQVWFDDTTKKSFPPQLRNTGFVFQDYALFPHFTVEENLSFALQKEDDKSIVTELLEATGLTQLAGRKPFQLSGGQQQRVALARALVRKPRLLLLDEPFAALDYAMRYSLQALLLKFRQQFRFSIIIVTHDIGELFRLADQVIVMDHGKIEKAGTPAELFIQENTSTQDFIIHGEVLACTKQNNQLHVSALIENKIRMLTLPLHFETELIPGNNFTLHYPLDSAQIRLITPS